MAKTEKDWEAFDAERFANACAEIAASPNLRFFTRVLFDQAGLHESPIGDNALRTAHRGGRHSLGMDLVATLNAFEPELFPNLLLEDAREQLERGKT